MEKNHESVVPAQECGTITILDPSGGEIVFHVGSMISGPLGDKILSLLSMSLTLWNQRSQETGFLENHMEVKEWKGTHDGLSITVQLKD